MEEKELWSVEFEKGQAVLYRNTYCVIDYEDGRRIYSSERNMTWQYPNGMHERCFNEDPEALVGNYLEWLTEEILPRDIKSLEKLLGEIKALKSLEKAFE